ncbi:hypothetical protein H9P43_005532 [Blastocladiella emersonii ATCC 22665]|nr:hypothetical protein H9P43_005532 [Blastocladiella emersonii ATCC 22665]
MTPPPPTVTRATAADHLLRKTKPPGSLGALEAWASKLMVVQGTVAPHVDRPRMLLFAADNGLGDETSQYPRAVTREMLRNVAEGGAAINCLCRAHGIDLKVMDLGVDSPLSYATVDHFRLLPHGTACPDTAPAMEPVTFSFAMSHGRKALQAARGDAVDVLGIGELGIGNTAVASTLLGAATGKSAADVTGAGTGVSGERYAAKCALVDRVLAAWRSVIPATPLDASPAAAAKWAEVLRCAGDLEITAMATVVHEAAVAGGPLVVLDGFITLVAALYALLLFPADAPAIVRTTLVSHLSAEKAARGVLSAMAEAAVARGADPEEVKEWVVPVGEWGMRLGEGSGAALVIPLLRSAAFVASQMATFEGAGVSTAKE